MIPTAEPIKATIIQVRSELLTGAGIPSLSESDAAAVFFFSKSLSGSRRCAQAR